jgi:hypothetical protein
MIERHQYVEMIKTGNFDVNVFYDYYSEFNENALFKFSINEFNMLFNNYINIIGINNALNTIRKYYDNKFNIITLSDAEGKLINVL